MAKRIDGGAIAAALGALLLFVSLFLDWYAPSISAWTAFEALDMVMALLCLATFFLVVPKAMGQRVAGGPPEGLLLGIGVAAFVIVGVQLINHPPAAIGLDEEVGSWLGLAGAVLMLVGGVLSRAQISLTVTVRDRATERERAEPAPAPAAAPAEPAPTAERRIPDDQNA